MTLAIESFETEDELDAVKHPAPRFQLGDPGYADTGIPDDHLYCTCKASPPPANNPLYAAMEEDGRFAGQRPATGRDIIGAGNGETS